MPLLLLLIAIILSGLFLYWQLVLAEGAYFGKGAVAWLYNFVAHRYNKIKQYDADDDARFLGHPLVLSLQGTPQPIVLDVATGTSRLPLALCQQSMFHGQIIALDNARRMLHEATQYVRAHRDRVTWVWQHAAPLPFADDTFDLVTCLEALEFMPSTPAALREFVRVLKPGGLLLITNRTGSGRRLMPGKTYGQAQFEALLQSLQQTDITTQIWQYDYDLVWSLKAGLAEDRSDELLTPIELLRCPACRAQLDRTGDNLKCRSCGRRYPIGRDGVIELLAVRH
jgi:ubiquinone/menaquinone biosynthesis C-methylase UbiE